MEKTETIYEWLEEVKDPEIPVISIRDLGVLRNIAWNGNKLHVTITPTYSGCPAMDVIAMQIRMKLLQKGIRNIEIHSVLSPAWTTDWITERGRDALLAYGIAPPNSVQQVCTPEVFGVEEAVGCPRCRSHDTRLVSRFGSTPCKALYQCNVCQEPFDYFKCH